MPSSVKTSGVQRPDMITCSPYPSPALALSSIKPTQWGYKLHTTDGQNQVRRKTEISSEDRARLSQSTTISDGYDVGRNDLVAGAVGQTSYGGVTYSTMAQGITGLLAPGSAGVNHGGPRILRVWLSNGLMLTRDSLQEHPLCSQSLSMSLKRK
ncbi:hypothetical protein V8E55_002986 [Tylopilus felleus]